MTENTNLNALRKTRIRRFQKDHWGSKQRDSDTRNVKSVRCTEKSQEYKQGGAAGTVESLNLLVHFCKKSCILR